MRSDALHVALVAIYARRSVWLPWLVAFIGFAFDISTYWPGLMSFDSAYAWWQVRGGESSDTVPPLFVDVWRLCDAFVAGPGGLFALHLALFWSGLALCMRALCVAPLAACAGMALVAFAPLPWLLRGHVWTDVGLLAALMFATGALANAQVERRRRWLTLALPALFYAAALRHNALPAMLPFAAWCAWLALRDVFSRARPAVTHAVLALIVMLVAMIGAARGLDARVDRRVPLWPSLAQFDLAAISVATGHMRLPDFMIGPGLDVDELGAAFEPWSNVPMLQHTRHGMHDPFSEYTDAQLRRLRMAWREAIVDEPRAWLAHRWTLTRALFGTHPRAWPHELVYVDEEVGYRDNPPVARNAGWLHAGVMRGAAFLFATPALAAWPYLALGLIGGCLAWRRRAEVAGRLVAIVLISAWLYALPLTLLAPSAEVRYLGWPCVASLLAFGCAVFSPRPPARC